MLRLIAFLMLPLLAACATTGEPPAFASDRIGVSVRGEGPDVVLIPGLSSSPEVWDSTIAALPGYRYHIVHVSGFGGRPVGANADGPVVAPVAGEIARYVREAGLERPAIIGHSLGGSWAMAVAARNPGLVSRVMVVDMLPFLGAMFGGPDATPDSVRAAAEQSRRGIAGVSEAQRRAASEATIATMIATEALRPRAVAHAMASDPAVSGQAMYDLITTDLRAEIATLDVPLTVLWVHPPAAPVTEAQMGQFYAASFAGVPHARIVHVPDSRHFIMWDAPEAFQALMREFLTGD